MSKEKKHALSEAEGVIPELRFPEFEKEGDWELNPFSNFIKLYRGSSPRPIRDYLTQSENGVNWIKIGDTGSVNDFIIRSVTEKITPKGAEKSRKVKKGELILANSMSYGNTYQLALDGCIYDGWFVLREYEEVFNKQFLLQVLNSDYMQEQYKKFAAGGIVQNISSEIVYSTLLPGTSVKEQQKIASCLSSLDELIAAHNDKLQSLKDHKKGLMQNLFPQEGQKVPNYRFPEFEGDGEWVKFKLGKIAENLDSRRIPITSNQREKGDIPYYGASGVIDFVKDYIFNEDLLLISEDGANLIARVYPIAFSISGKSWVNNHAHVLKFENWFTQVLVEKYLNSKNIEDFLTGMAQPKLNRQKLDLIPVLLPKSEEEQQKIASSLSALDELITAQSERIEQLQQHKKGVMQGLFPKIEINS